MSLFKTAPLLLVTAAVLNGCGGGGGSGDSFPGTDSGTLPDDPVTTTYSISGTLIPTAGITVDSDINDFYADYTSNDDADHAQALSNSATVQGFASKVGSNGLLSGNPGLERFADSGDQYDFYRVSLQANQTIQLQVVDYNGDGITEYQGDLDLYLLDSATSTLIDSSLSDTSEFETVTVPSDGDYLITVVASSGISKYVLQILAASSTAASTPAADFAANQILLKTRSGNAQAARKAGISRAAMTLSADAGPALLTIDRSRSGASFSAASATDPLFAANPETYAKIQTLKDIKALRAQDDVVYAEPNYIRKPLTTPNDTYYSYQWHYPKINLPAAWDLSKGDDVIVAVIDTGVFLTHEDLSGQLVSGYDFISDASNALDGDGIDDNPDDPGDSTIAGQSSWHGTHVAGTVAAASNNSQGVAGVAWNAKVMPVRVLGKDGGYSSDIIQGIRYAAGLSNNSNTLPAQKADIINLSLGGSSSSQAEQDAIAAARNAGVIIVAAAGNSAVSTPFYPAAYNGVISVSATDFNDNLSSYSNYGTTIDVAAPGGEASADANGDNRADGIMSTYVNDQSGTRRSDYTYFMQGTSMATPHVAGVIALMKSAYPDLTPTDVDNLLHSCAITNKVNDSSCSRDNQFGYGRIDAYLAVTEAQSMNTGGTVSDYVSLQSSPSSLLFGSTSTVLSFTLSNAGSASADITDVTSDAAWLSVTASSTGADGLGSYTATADRSALSDGYYSATITASDASGVSVNIVVYLQQGSGTSSAMTQQYVLLEDVDCTSECTLSIAANADGSFAFSNIPAGNYRLLAGSDIDVDNLICQTAETCGAYPNLGAVQVIELNSNLSGMNFLVSLNSGLSSGSLAHRITATGSSADAGKAVAE